MYSPNSSRNICLRAPKQTIANYFCPTKSIEYVDAALARIRMKASQGNPIRSFAPKEHTFKCKSCGHDEAYEDPNGSTCKKCSARHGKVETGKEYRDIQERTQEKGDLNHCGMKHNIRMSIGYNHSTFLSERDHTGKQLPSKFKQLTKVHRESMVYKDTKDKHILTARAAFADMCDRVCFGANVREALELFARFVNAVPSLRDPHVVHAACMFHTLKTPQGKVWKKKFRNKKFNDSKKKRLKMMIIKKRPLVLKKYRE